MLRKAVLLALGLSILACAMAGCSPQAHAEAGTAAIGSVPWGDYEKATYDIYRGSDRVGSAEFVIEKSASGDTYSISKTKTVGVESVSSGAVVRADTLAPVSSYYRSSEGDITTSYGDKWNLVVPTAKDKNISVDVPAGCFDNESLLTVMRAFRLGAGQAAKVTDAIPRTARIETLPVSLEGQESVAVPYRVLDCDIVKLGDQTVWYAKGGSRLLAQFQDGDTLYKLSAVETVRP